MENSLKGVAIAVCLIAVFIICITSFVINFPVDQGVGFTGEGQNAYLTIANNSMVSDEEILLTNQQNSTNDAFNKWDVTQGFMGSGQMKQSQTGIGTQITSVFTNLLIIAKLLFKNGDTINPVIIVLGIFSALIGTLLIYFLYSFVRTGR